MKFTLKNTIEKGKRVQVYDATGIEITHVVSFDTKTSIVELYLTGFATVKNEKKIFTIKRKLKNKSYEFESVIVKVKIKGAYAIVDGQKS